MTIPPSSSISDRSHFSSRLKRNLVLIFLFVILIVILWIIYSRINVFPLPDFIEYWASGRINIAGGNPYDPIQMLAMERTVGWSVDDALMMLSPPTTLFYGMFLGIFSYSVSRFLGFIIQISLLSWCSILLWKIFKGTKKDEWIAWIILLTFGPILHALRSGQITILVLVGSVGFLYFITKKSDFWSGIFASLVLVKPHLLYLFVIAVFVWSLSRRRFYVLIGLASGLITSLCIAWVFNPQVISQYLNMLRYYPFENWMTSTLGAFLRASIGPEVFYLQFIPSVVGVIWFIIYWLKRHENFNWTTSLPLIVLVSIVISPYGWTLDFSVIVISVIRVAALFDNHNWKFNNYLIFTTYLISNLLIITVSMSQNWFWWFPSFMLIWYLVSIRQLSGLKNAPVTDDALIPEVR